MTVIPFPTPGPRTDTLGRPRLATVVEVTGSLDSPTGRAGTFTGSYRLERFLVRSGQLMAGGVFTGELADADGSRIGMDSRRQTTKVQVVASGSCIIVRLGPQDVSLLGLIVSVAEVGIEVHGGAQQCAGRESLRLVDTPAISQRLRLVSPILAPTVGDEGAHAISPRRLSRAGSL